MAADRQAAAGRSIRATPASTSRSRSTAQRSSTASTDVPACRRSCPRPAINYLAKDYASFRQLMLDRLALIMPDWRERHVPDLGITLVELLAYVGDYLSYYQDAVATEAYLDTARQRISVRRHARLVDYLMHEGCNARAFLACRRRRTATTARSAPRTGSIFVTGFTRRAPDRAGEHEVESAQAMARVRAARRAAVDAAPAGRTTTSASTPGATRSAASQGATRATLIDEPPGSGSRSPSRSCATSTRSRRRAAAPSTDRPRMRVLPTASSARAGHTRRCSCRPATSCCSRSWLAPAPVYPPRKRAMAVSTRRSGDAGRRPHPSPRRAADAGHAGVSTRCSSNRVLEMEWAREDALPFPLCVSAIGTAPECDCVDARSPWRGATSCWSITAGPSAEELDPIADQPRERAFAKGRTILPRSPAWPAATADAEGRTADLRATAA